MILANELRIGNLVYLNDDDIIENQNVYEGIAIHKITGEDVKMADFPNDDFNLFYKAIPINEEWIKKFNLLVIRENMWRFDNYVIEYFYKKIFVIKAISMTNQLIPIGKEIKFVHEFQNIVFALTQKELEYVG